jgi:hypothetical protein
MFRTGVGGNCPGKPTGGVGHGQGAAPDRPPAPDCLDVRRPASKNGRPEPRALLVEHLGADAETRWSRALELLLEAGIATTTDIEGDDGGGC